MTTFKRAQRVAERIMAELSEILVREVSDPRMKSLTITGVKVTDDLRLARIYFVEMGQDVCRPETRQALQKANGFLRRELGKRLELRYVPEVVFSFDPSFAYGSRIEKILAGIRAGREENDSEDN
ncbi:MAG TPA: 30S ribosome-binding factor RbfA [Syntrophales bacterium]|jgi:ribosome-binding factor A|nr:30S ribosome-binding factor RbfA [Syntrophales bacterium]HOD98176.1 30S ribosome-binding factor RbfA [Syntrophales bacterium]HOH73148.1 30S ribosome-binding factor RbfA [Syntrophales bacterium]HPN09586.1 30S ribosome-binding factor RbfA [Syntrophales bacterium]HPN10295.1 30S ribosome-binding factor RbfA [Syntrophales bacterium]